MYMAPKNPGKQPSAAGFLLAVALIALSGVGASRRALLLSVGKFDEDAEAPGVAETISVSFEAEYAAYAARDTAQAYSLLSLTCPPREADVDRPPLLLSVVMDRSGSMSGDKIALLKKTTEFLVTRLTEKDKLGIVAYADDVTEVMPLTNMTQAGRDNAIGRISDIRARGYTNLSGGLLKGISQQVDEASSNSETNAPAVRAVLLLTDGLANVGITSTLELRAAMEEGFAGTSMAVFTFGYGSDHDGELLAALAEAGSGDYFFIEQDESLPRAFGSVLGGLMATSCQDLEVTIFPEEGVTLDASAGSLQGSQDVGAGALHLTMRDLFAEERRDLVIQMDLSALPEAADSQPVLRALVRYLDTQRGEVLEESASLTIARPEAVPADTAPSQLVIYHRTRLEAAAKIKEAKAAADEPCISVSQSLESCNGLDRAKQILSDFLSVIVMRRAVAEASMADQAADDGYNALLMTVSAVLEGFQDTNTFLNSGQFVAFSASAATKDQGGVTGYAPRRPDIEELAQEAEDYVLGTSP